MKERDLDQLKARHDEIAVSACQPMLRTRSVWLQLERNVICILCFTREMCRIECGHPGKLLVDVMQRILRKMTTRRRGRPY